MNKRPPVEMQDIFNLFGDSYRNSFGNSMPRKHFRIMRAIELCRTSALGGHIEKCDSCGKLRASYNSCRNRHCPKCQFLKREKWLEERSRDILPIRYFHVVFTVPDILNPLILRNKKMLYDILFKSSAEALRVLAGDDKYLGADIGFTGILHTWGQNLMDHPHIHFIVTGGGLSVDGKKWLSSRKSFFLPVKVLSTLFRGKFLFYLRKSYLKDKINFPGTISYLNNPDDFGKFMSRLYSKKWVVYLKPPFKNANTVFEYLSRYTHRIAISNYRIIKIENDHVFFKWKDYSDSGKTKVMELHAHEFIRRFLLHSLPDKYVRIRHFGIFSNRFRRESLVKIRSILSVPYTENSLQQFSWKEKLLQITGIDVDLCPFCKKGNMNIIENLIPAHCNSPPEVVQ